MGTTSAPSPANGGTPDFTIVLRGYERTQVDMFIERLHARIDELGDSSVAVRLFAWVDQRSFEFFAVRTEAIRRIKEAFDQAGYDLPEPIYRVHMIQRAQPVEKPKPPPDAACSVDLAPDRGLQRQAEELAEAVIKPLLESARQGLQGRVERAVGQRAEGAELGVELFAQLVAVHRCLGELAQDGQLEHLRAGAHHRLLSP